LIFIVILLVLAAVCIEGCARIAFALKEKAAASRPPAAVNAQLNLDVYEVPDNSHPVHFRLKPGYEVTVGELLEQKRKQGRVLAVEIIDNLIKEGRTSPDDPAIKVNKHGFRGPEIDESHSAPRILTIGDSCTFGMWIDSFTYPRIIEKKLEHDGLPVEVINGGVEGYSPRNVLFRINEYKSLEPEITTVYIGWNALFNPEYYRKAGYRTGRWLKSVELIEKLSSRLLGPKELALRELRKEKHPDPDSARVRALDDYVPPFMDDVEKITEEMGAAGSRVVLITLAGLYTMKEEPGAGALEIGHLPVFTDNPYVLAKMSEKYNRALRDLASQKNLVLIDFEKWSSENLQPREKYFTDSVHMTREGQQMMGEYIAGQLEPMVEQFHKKGSYPKRSIDKTTVDK